MAQVCSRSREKEHEKLAREPDLKRAKREHHDIDDEATHRCLDMCVVQSSVFGTPGVSIRTYTYVHVRRYNRHQHQCIMAVVRVIPRMTSCVPYSRTAVRTFRSWQLAKHRLTKSCRWMT